MDLDPDPAPWGRGSGRIQAVFRTAYPHLFSADLDPLFNADPCRGILLFTLFRIRILLLGVADLVGSKPFSGLRIHATLMRIWIRSFMPIRVRGILLFTLFRIRNLNLGVAGIWWIQSLSRIADPRHFNADLDTSLILIRVGSLFFTSMRIRIPF